MLYGLYFDMITTTARSIRLHFIIRFSVVSLGYAHESSTSFDTAGFTYCCRLDAAFELYKD